jgi:hypothetical protein
VRSNKASSAYSPLTEMFMGAFGGNLPYSTRDYRIDAIPVKFKSIGQAGACATG